MNKRSFSCTILVLIISVVTFAQDIKRERPKAWDNLVRGGAFIDRFEPIPPIGKLTSDTWGSKAVLPRYVDNGIEDPNWSYWGGNIVVGPDGLYHLFVCRWPENNPKGHMYWSNSEVVHTVSANRFGPYKVKGDPIGKGHNPEIFRLKDGRYVIYVIDANYISDSLDGPWKKGKFDFDPRDRKIIEGLSNLTFTKREDGSVLMVCRGGGIWISKTGLSPYYQISNKSVYPAFDGRYEDPVVWRTGFQYHLIVNDWYGRIAYHLRSKDGVNWKVEPGEAYTPGIAKYTDGTVVDWYKYERIKILQDEQGRAIQANFAVIDTSKWGDLGNDRHSSKNISVPLTKERLISVLNKKKITGKTKSIEVKIQAENDFDPLTEVNIGSLHFGASEEVNFGNGSKAVSSHPDGKDLVVVFSGKENGLTDRDFAGKLLGETNNGKLLIGYSKLPGIQYIEPVLSAREPVFKTNGNKTEVEFEVQNFGQVKSQKSGWELHIDNGSESVVLEGKVPGLQPYEKTMVKKSFSENIPLGKNCRIKIILTKNVQKLPLYDREVNLDSYFHP